MCAAGAGSVTVRASARIDFGLGLLAGDLADIRRSRGGRVFSRQSGSAVALKEWVACE